MLVIIYSLFTVYFPIFTLETESAMLESKNEMNITFSKMFEWQLMLPFGMFCDSKGT